MKLNTLHTFNIYHKFCGFTNFELFLNLRQFLHFLAQFEGSHDGIRTRQCHVGGTGQTTVGVEPWSWPLQRVVVLLRDAVGALAGDRMRLLDGVIAWQEHLDDLMIVVVSGQDQRRDVWWKLTLLVSPKERIVLSASTQLGAGDVVRVLDNDLKTTNAGFIGPPTVSASYASFFILIFADNEIPVPL